MPRGTVGSPVWNGGEVKLRFWELAGASGVVDNIGRAVPFEAI